MNIRHGLHGDAKRAAAAPDRAALTTHATGSRRHLEVLACDLTKAIGQFDSQWEAMVARIRSDASGKEESVESIQVC